MKRTYKLSYKTKDITLERKLTDEMSRRIKKDHVTLNKHDP